MNLETIISELQFPTEIEQTVLSSVHTNKRKLLQIADTAYYGEDFDFALCKRMPLTRLTVVVCLLLRKYEEYKAKGISDDIIFDTFRDVTLRAKLYYAKTGKVGIEKGDVIWFRHIMNLAIFKIGSLQFQPFEMIYLDEETIGERYITFEKEQKEALPAGTPVINCHIQQNANLSPEMVKISFQNAKTFFSTYFSGVQYKAILCYSWLLYPPMVNCLSPKSNIRQFAENFSIIGACNDSEQAMEYLFGHKIKKILPENATSLQKLAFEKKDLFGFACGIMPQ